MRRLLLVRHGETAWNAAKILQGQADIELSERGRAQALALAPVLRHWAPDEAWTSDLQRTRQTAALLGWPAATVDARWREADLGDWTSRDVYDLTAQEPARYQRWRDGIEAPPGGESMPDFRQRVGAAIDALRARDGDLLVITHGGVIRAVLAQTLALTSDRVVAVEPGSLTAIDMSASPRLLAFNLTAFGLDVQTTD
ncbi:MAG: histidine phosphatase family protein [Rubrivivax sp.]|nr:histidine phosphatase family protein [Rubrivivax sp.]MDP3613138.1 histidine phosphatase family protein [Rubrivivax sp.]